MKTVIKNLALFAALVVAFSSFSGCSGTSSSGTDNSSASKNGGPSDRKISDDMTYPPLVSSVANTEFELLDGSKQTIADHKGKVVLINMWATWCGPCIGEMPHLRALQDKYRDKGLEIIGLSIGADGESGTPEDVGSIEAFAKKQQLNYTLGRSPRPFTDEVQKLARFQGIPLSLLVSRDGRLRAVLRGGGPVGVQQMTESVDRAMAE